MINDSIDNKVPEMPQKKLIIILSSIVFILLIILGFVLENQFKVFSNIVNKKPEVNTLDYDPTIDKDIEDEPIEQDTLPVTETEKPVEETPVTNTPTTTTTTPTTPVTQNPPPTTVPPTPTSTPYSFVLKETSWNESMKVDFTVPSSFPNVVVTSKNNVTAPEINLKYGNTQLNLRWDAGPRVLIDIVYSFYSIQLVQSRTLMSTAPDASLTFSNFGDLYRVKYLDRLSWYYSNRVETQKECLSMSDPEPINPPCGRAELYLPAIFNLECSGADIAFCDYMSKNIWLKEL